MGFGVGIFLIAVGAILTWAVRNPADSSVNVHVVGVILMLVGLAGFLFSLLFWESWAGPGYWLARRRYAAGTYPASRWYWSPVWSRYRPRTYVEEGPPAPPPNAPPPY
jgi:hypothetical protein